MSDNFLKAGLFGIFVFALSKIKAVMGYQLPSVDNVTASRDYPSARIAPSYAPEVDEYQLDIMARTIWGESRGEGYKGMQAVANVIMNRVQSSRFPDTPAAVCLQKYQFSVWLDSDAGKAAMLSVNENDTLFAQAKQIAKKAILGNLSDVTGGADHYLNERVTRQIRGGSLPSWVSAMNKTKSIGQHTFLRS